MLRPLINFNLLALFIWFYVTLIRLTNPRGVPVRSYVTAYIPTLPLCTCRTNSFEQKDNYLPHPKWTTVASVWSAKKELCGFKSNMKTNLVSYSSQIRIFSLASFLRNFRIFEEKKQTDAPNAFNTAKPFIDLQDRAINNRAVSERPLK